MEKHRYDLSERTFKFALLILDVASRLPRNIEVEIIRSQLIRSATSVGAHVEEADGSSTRPDFSNKIVNARKEARETRFWLKIIQTRHLQNDDLVEKSIQESTELIKIFSAIVSKIK